MKNSHKQAKKNVLRKLCFDENEITLNNFTISFSESSLKRLSLKNSHTSNSLLYILLPVFMFFLCHDCQKSMLKINYKCMQEKLVSIVYDRQCCETFLWLFQPRIKFSQIKQNEMRLENKTCRETTNINWPFYSCGWVTWLWLEARLPVTLFWYKPLCFSYANEG